MDISDLDRNMLIRALWKNLETSGKGYFEATNLNLSSGPSDEEIQKAFFSTYLDSLNGCLLKLNFHDPKNMETRIYNRLAQEKGRMTFEQVVNRIRKEN